MIDIILILLGLTTVFLVFLRHWLLLKRIRQIESDIKETRAHLEWFEDRRFITQETFREQFQLLSIQIEELNRRCH